MSDNLMVADLLELAALNEQDGYAFYVESAKKLNEEKLIDFFNFLAEEELRHHKFLTDYKNRIDSFIPREPLPREYNENLKNCMSSLSPKKNTNLKESVEEITTIEEALELAFNFEKDSVVFYAMLKTVASQDLYPMLDKIIEEEVKHIVKIQEYKTGELPSQPDKHAT